MYPLLSRRNLDKAKRVHQFLRDVEDENLWIQDRKPIAADNNIGNSLQSVQTLQKKNQSLATEIDNHEPQVRWQLSSYDIFLS